MRIDTVPGFVDHVLHMIGPHLTNSTVAGIVTVTGSITRAVHQVGSQDVGGELVPVAGTDFLEMGRMGEFVDGTGVEFGVFPVLSPIPSNVPLIPEQP